MSVTKKHFDERMDDLKQMIENLRIENSALKQENSDLKNAIIAVKEQCLSTELYVKRKNLLIHGIPNKDSENIEETVHDFLSGMPVQNSKDIKFTAMYRIRNKTKRPSRSNSRPVSDPIFVSVLNLRHKDRIMACVGSLKGTGKSISNDLPSELAKRRKELLSTAYKLRNSKVTAEKVSQTKVMQQGTKLWLETKKLLAQTGLSSVMHAMTPSPWFYPQLLVMVLLTRDVNYRVFSPQ